LCSTAAFAAGPVVGTETQDDIVYTPHPGISDYTIPAFNGDSECACIDIVFVIDDTGSMFGAIDNVKAGILDILALADSTCGDVQCGVLSFKDNVDVDQNFTFNQALCVAAINGLFASGGAGGPEASDEGVCEAVSETACPSGVGGDFNDSGWRTDCCKRLIMVTDNYPAQCNDFYETADSLHAIACANAADAKGVAIGALYVGGDFPDATIERVMQNYASITDGLYGITPFSGLGTATAMEAVILSCKQTPPAFELCCFSPGDCFLVDEGTCVPAGGTVVTDCDRDCPPPTATESKTWGSVKSLYE
jgi:hypothetical protein